MTNRQKWIPRVCAECYGAGQVGVINPRWLQWRRAGAGLSLRAMARWVGVSAAYLSDIERGRRGGNSKIIEAYDSLSRPGGESNTGSASRSCGG